MACATPFRDSVCLWSPCGGRCSGSERPAPSLARPLAACVWPGGHFCTLGLCGGLWGMAVPARACVPGEGAQDPAALLEGLLWGPPGLGQRPETPAPSPCPAFRGFGAVSAWVVESWAGVFWPRGEPCRGGQPWLQPSALPAPSWAPSTVSLGPPPRETARQGREAHRPGLPAGAPGTLPCCVSSAQGLAGASWGRTPGPGQGCLPHATGQNVTCGGCAGICGDVGFPFSWIHSVENGICPGSKQVCGDGCSAALLLFLLHPCHSLQTCCDFLFLLRRGCFPPGRLQGERPRQGGSRPAGTGSWLSAQLAGRGRVAGAGQRGGRRAVSAEQVAACLGGRAPAPRTSAFRAWPWGHWGCWGHGAGGAGGPGLPSLGASFHRAQVCAGTRTAEARV